MTLYFSWGASLLLEDFMPSDAVMVRQSGIAATRPVFPRYLLPCFKWIPFVQFCSTIPSTTIRDGNANANANAHSSPSEQLPASSSSSSSSSSTTIIASPGDDGTPSPHNYGDENSNVPSSNLKRLSCTAEDTIKCSACSSDLAFASQIISKGFTGRHGRAILVAPMKQQQQRQNQPSSAGGSLLNIRIGKNEHRQLVTGWHTVADISCETCSRKLGWKYVDAEEESQQYKISKFILETERVVTYRNWNDILAGKDSISIDELNDDGELRSDAEDEIEFDSGDEDECDDIFAGVWDAKTAAERRNKSLGWRARRR